MQRPEYSKVFAISQSAIKCFRKKTLQEFYDQYVEKKEEEEDDDKFTFGNLVDTLAFNPELMDERFYIADEEIELPGEAVKYVVDNTYKEALSVVETKLLLNEKGNLPEPIWVPSIQNIWDFTDIVLKYAKEKKIGGTTWKSDRIIQKVVDDGIDYFQLLSISNGRQVITARDNADAVEVVTALRSNPLTAKYFVPQENETLLFQQEIFVDYDYADEYGKTHTVLLKGALDILRFNHVDKTVQVPDLKTTHTSETFVRQAREYGYITQVSFYHKLLSYWLKTYEDGKYADYRLETPLNVVIDRKTKIPYIYEYQWDELEIAQFGSEDKNIIGWEATLEEILWHLDNQVWDKPRELYQNGKIILKIYR